MTKIGLAGVGRMGGGMLANLRKNGIDAVGFDIRDPSEFTLPVTNDVAAFANGLTTLITVVRDAAQTDALLLDTQKLIAAAPDLHTLIISSTVSPRYLLALREKLPADLNVIDAPMSGAEVGAREGTLAFMIGGTEAQVADNMVLFECMGKLFKHMGAFSMGAQAKVLNNMLCASHVIVGRLALDWAREAGLDEDKLLDLFDGATAQNWFTSRYKDIEFAKHGYEPDNTIAIFVKDLGCMVDAVPEGASTAIPQLLIEHMRGLKPVD
ncbi:NAD(P)-dependent oxidoreductase [Celeribacter sp.]|uniref:NAD(P)-dependent oxidoreductase n=1 Tax=Celeribacter sp. TaxID=1890673 RepID=UPI003A917C3F